MAENTFNNDKKVMSQIERMQEMMNYGLQTESKSYRSVEHERKGADGNTYAIIREGSKYHIKVSDKKKPLKEDYEYIGGFQNHMNNQYDSYANALKHFDMKMTSLNEAYGENKTVDSWNVNGRDEILAEASDKMKLEIARMREIMKNTSVITEGKGEVCKDCKNEIEKKNINLGSATTGDAKNVGGDFYTEDPKGSDMENIGEYEDRNQKNEVKAKVGNKKTVTESAGPIIDATLSVADEIKKTPEGQAYSKIAPFSAIGMSNADKEVNENCETECGGALEEEDEFETEEDFDFTDEPTGSEEEIDLDVDMEDDEELETFSDEDEDFTDEPAEDEVADETNDEVSALKAEIETLRSTIEAIADKLGVNEFDEDEPLYPEDEEDTEYELEVDSESDDEEDDYEDTSFDVEDGDDFEEDEEVTVYESRAYRQAMLNEGGIKNTAKKCAKGIGKACKKMKEKFDDFNWEAENTPAWHADDEEWDKFEGKKAARKANKSKGKDSMEETVLHDFGKHPRFKKEPFTYPNPTMSKTQGQWEAGDENSPSKGKKPYASTIGDPKPYGENNKEITKTANSIAESIVRQLLKNH